MSLFSKKADNNDRFLEIEPFEFSCFVSVWCFSRTHSIRSVISRLDGISSQKKILEYASFCFIHKFYNFSHHKSWTGDSWKYVFTMNLLWCKLLLCRHNALWKARFCVFFLCLFKVYELLWCIVPELSFMRPKCCLLKWKALRFSKAVFWCHTTSPWSET